MTPPDAAPAPSPGLGPDGDRGDTAPADPGAAPPQDTPRFERRAQRPTARARHAWRELTAAWRPLPDFLVLGAQKAGTTTLFGWLAGQPGVHVGVRKEIHYFDAAPLPGERWYRAHFPTRRRLQATGPGPHRVGEATPFYLAHPLASRRIAALLPEVRCVALLRDPVERAHSHYHHKRRGGFETHSFEDALRAEPERLAGERERILADDGYDAFAFRHFGYMERGHYAAQLRELFEHVDRERVLVLRTDALTERPREVEVEVRRHLGLGAEGPPMQTRRNVGRYEPMSKAARSLLEEHFEPHDAELRELLGWEPW